MVRSSDSRAGAEADVAAGDVRSGMRRSNRAGSRVAAALALVLACALLLVVRSTFSRGGKSQLDSHRESTGPGAPRVAVPLQLGDGPVEDAVEQVGGGAPERESAAEVPEALDAPGEEVAESVQALELVDPRGAPLVGLPVQLRYSEPDADGRRHARATADEAGRVELGSLTSSGQGELLQAPSVGPWVAVAPIVFGEGPGEVVLRRLGPDFSGGVARVELDVGVWVVELEGRGGNRAGVAWEAPLEWLPSPRADLSGAARQADVAESLYRWRWVEAGQRMWVDPRLAGEVGHAFDPPGVQKLHFPRVGSVGAPGVLRVPTAQPELRLSGWFDPFDEGDVLLGMRVGSVESSLLVRGVEAREDGRFEWERSDDGRERAWGAPDLVSVAAVLQPQAGGVPRLAWRGFEPALPGRGVQEIGVLLSEPLPLLVSGRVEESVGSELESGGGAEADPVRRLLVERSKGLERRAQVLPGELIEALRELAEEGETSFAESWITEPATWSDPLAKTHRRTPPHVQVSSEIDEDGAFTVWGTWPEPTGWLRIGGCEPVEFRVGDEDVIVPVAR